MLRQQVQSAIIVAGAMISGWVIAWLTLDFGSDPIDATAQHSSTAEIDAVQRELDAMRQQLEAQAGRPGAPREVIREIRIEEPASADEGLPAILQKDPESLSGEEFAEWRAAELERQAKIFDGFDERLANEPRDQDWAPRAESSIEHQLAGLQAQGFATTRLISNECGSRTCRAEFVHDDPDEQRRFLHELRAEGEFVQSDVHIVEDPSGSLRTEAFFTRHDDVS